MSERKAVLIKRHDRNSNDVSESISLAESAGYKIEELIEEQGYEDPNYNIGESSMVNAYHIASEKECSTIIIDNEIDPYQSYNIQVYFGTQFNVIDRYQLILEKFKENAKTKHGKMQIELASLKYKLPRVEVKEKLSHKGEHPGFMGLGEYQENKSKSIKSKISDLNDSLKTYKEKNSSRRKRRKDQGFNLISLAGYTNAGKSALLRRLSQDHKFNENKNKHPDLDKVAKSHDELFTTLETTTRKMDHDKREILLTDTVGFIEGLPEKLLDSFHVTLDSITESELVLLVVDISENISEIRRKMRISHDILHDRGSPSIITVLNKMDKVENTSEKIEMISEFTENYVLTSAKTGDNIDKLKNKINKELPGLEKGVLKLPMRDESMSIVSEAHNLGNVKEEKYTKNNIILIFTAPAHIVRKILSQGQKVVAKYS